TAAVVKGRRISNQRSSHWPTRPRRPSAKKSATPPTTGGSTIDSVHNARTAPRPTNVTRASSHASGTPKRIDNAVDHNEHVIDSFSASSASDDFSNDQASRHGARHSKPMKGRAKNPTATTASAIAGSGRLRPLPRRRRAGVVTV